MGAEKGSASSSSKAGMSNKSAATSPVVQELKLTNMLERN